MIDSVPNKILPLPQFKTQDKKEAYNCRKISFRVTILPLYDKLRWNVAAFWSTRKQQRRGTLPVKLILKGKLSGYFCIKCLDSFANEEGPLGNTVC